MRAMLRAPCGGHVRRFHRHRNRTEIAHWASSASAHPAQAAGPLTQTKCSLKASDVLDLLLIANAGAMQQSLTQVADSVPSHTFEHNPLLRPSRYVPFVANPDISFEPLGCASELGSVLA